MSKRGQMIGILVIFVVVAISGFLAGPVGQGILNAFGLTLEMPSWLDVPKPEVHLPAATVFHIFDIPITNSIIGSWVTIVFLVIICYLATRRMKLVPGRLQSAFELLVGWLYSFCKNVAGEENGRRFFPLVATIFLYVAFNSWLSLIPGFGSITLGSGEHALHVLRGANTDINTPLALAAISFVYVEVTGLRTLGISYLSKFLNIGPVFRSLGTIFKGKVKSGLSSLFVAFIGVAVGMLELLSEFIRIVSFTIRLFGNMTAGEILLLVAAFLIPWAFAIPFYGLELLVGFVQALIFSGLTLVFLTVAVSSHHESE